MLTIKGISQEHHHDHLEKVAQKTSHPVSDVSFVIAENEIIFFEEEGFDKKPENRTLIQPILGLRIFDNKLTFATRATFEFLSAPHEAHNNHHSEADNQIERIDGFADLGLMSLFSTKHGHEGFIWGLGYSATFPTASKPELGTGKYQLGPAASLFYLGEAYGTGIKSINIGAFIAHEWSYAGDKHREETSLSSIQYVLMYRLTHTMQIGMEPKVTIDWKEDPDNRLNLPIGLGIGDVFNMGKIPIQWRVEGQYFLESSQLEKEKFAVVFTLEPILSSLLN
ncbi:MAG: hypothetical protein AAF551_12870 [Bacteroidota bacterium]